LKIHADVLILCLQGANPSKLSVFSLRDELQTADLDLIVKRGVITSIVMDKNTKPESSFFAARNSPPTPAFACDLQNPSQMHKILWV
jgi:hypothetical protein